MFNIFGSESSIDYDVMVFVERILSTDQCKQDAALQEDFLTSFLGTSRKINVNFAVVEDGVITDVYKGTPDECNNSVFATYNMHNQLFPPLVKRRVNRDVELKIARALRICLSFLSRSAYRAEVKAALRDTTTNKIATLLKIDLTKIGDLGKNNQDLTEFAKQIAFQVGQTLALMKGFELYTKEAISSCYPILAPYLQREQHSSLNMLERLKNNWLDKIKEQYNNLDEIIERRE